MISFHIILHSAVFIYDFHFLSVLILQKIKNQTPTSDKNKNAPSTQGSQIKFDNNFPNLINFENLHFKPL